MDSRKPYIVGFGGTTREGSSSEQALSIALAAAKAGGAEVEMFGGHALMLPMYDPDPKTMTSGAKHFVEALRRADGVIISSPVYHGATSGLIKNAIDYIEEMRADPRVYLDNRAIGIIACGYGYQGPGMVLAQLRQITHALRGWPVPLGVAVNSGIVKFTNGESSEAAITTQIGIMAGQVVEFAQHRIAHAKA